jgi:sigma-B regulation protein RsbU (phosphoserine phosphatase)
LVAAWREIGGPVPLNETQHPNRFDQLPSEERQLLESLSPGVLVILPGEKRIEGILALGAKRFGDRYRAEDLELLATIGEQAGLALSGSRLHEEALEKRRMEEELAVARRIQKSLLPAKIPRRDGLEIAAMTRPCRQVGGDFYDFLDFGADGLGLAVADVSGKGVPAALILSNLQATLRAEAKPGYSPVPVVQRINQRLCGDLQPGSFASLLFGHLDVAAGTFRYVNAGHPAGLLLRRDGAIRRLSAGGVLLGVESSAVYEVGVAPFEPGDLLILYSDGVTDVLNDEEEEFGSDRLERMLPRFAGLPLPGILQEIVGTVEGFVGGALPDDLTLLVARSVG